MNTVKMLHERVAELEFLLAEQAEKTSKWKKVAQDALGQSEINTKAGHRLVEHLRKIATGEHDGDPASYAQGALSSECDLFHESAHGEQERGDVAVEVESDLHAASREIGRLQGVLVAISGDVCTSPVDGLCKEVYGEKTGNYCGPCLARFALENTATKK